MGSMIHAKCECGFHAEDMLVGGGMMDFKTKCNVPILCKNCGILFVGNIIARKYLRCPKCRRKAIPYSDVSLQGEERGSAPIFNCWLGNSGGFTLPDTNYYCPKCKQKRMRFLFAGSWD
jgi:Zn finger protein HypA/HybF involved in hydrogenase expression